MAASVKVVTVSPTMLPSLVHWASRAKIRDGRLMKNGSTIFR